MLGLGSGSSAERQERKLAEQGGFVLPIVIFGLMLMGTMTVAALLTAGDESRSGRAMRESTGAFYAAEAGLNWVYANWDTVKADADTLSGGNHVDFGWRTLSNGDSYRAVIYRWDEGAQPIYQLVVEGRSGGVLGSRRKLSYMLTSDPAGPGEGYKLGLCCDAPVLVRGDADVKDNSVVSGYDEHPAGWADADVCSDSLYDKPGLIIQETDSVNLSSGGSVIGDPPLLEDTGIDDGYFSQFGDLSWEEVKAMAEIVIGEPGSSDSYDAGDIYPRYTTDPMTGELLCDTSHPYNWGSPDPNDPCFNHFPVVLVQGDVDLQDSVYAQGIFITDFWTDSLGVRHGSELDLEDDVVYNGLILGKGCVEVQRLANMHGAVFADGVWGNVLCGGDDTFDINDEGYMTWSQCAVDRALYNSIFQDYAEPTVPPPGGGPQLLGSRSFAEGFR
ncbi:MAG: hypothetical protein PVJ64_00790 [Gemmatimonadales bacterium]|jgi:hypothetical protein